MREGSRGERSLAVARRVGAVLTREGTEHAVIGAAALAAHGFVRATRDLDLAILVPPVPRLAALAEALRLEGFQVAVSTPGGDDELGGVVTVSGDGFDPVQLVNFYNPPRRPPAVVREAIDAAIPDATLGLPVVGLAHLVALKLATGAFRDEVDVGDLLDVRRDVALDEVRGVCARHGVADALTRVLARLGR